MRDRAMRVASQKFIFTLFSSKPKRIAMGIKQSTGITTWGVEVKALAAVLPKTAITSTKVIQTNAKKRYLDIGLSTSPEMSGRDLPLCLVEIIRAR
jgi:hypothetical protein